ncbi:MAG: hypothetical protein M3400_15870 [Actinomycetota bacterium]|nr:hypothetical protein [Actinomycetota bacterium]
MCRQGGLLGAALAVAFLFALAPLTSVHADGQGGPARGLSAFPAAPIEEDPELPCLPTDVFCNVGEGFDWLGGEVGEAIGDLWIACMTALWEAGLWLLALAFSVIDAFTTPDLSADGPMGEVYPFTFAIGAAVAVLMALIQVGAAAFRRDGQSLGRLAIGVVQFGLVWVGYIGLAALLVTGVSGLTNGLLDGLLDIDNFAQFDVSLGIEREITDGTLATVLGLSSLCLLFPASAAYLLLMLVRAAALMILAATSAIVAGGLFAETSRAWFWKSLRWFIAALLMSPLAVLVLGIGVNITEGVVAGRGDDDAAAVGMAVVGCLLILVGAICPLILFRLLAFVDPGTMTGLAMRQSLMASGGVLGLLGGAGSSVRGGSRDGSGAGTGASTRVSGGRAQGESTAEGSTQGRFGGAIRAFATGSAAAGQIAGTAAAVGSDVLIGAGVGHQALFLGPPGSGPIVATRRVRAGSSGAQPPPSLGGPGAAPGPIRTPTRPMPQTGGGAAALPRSSAWKADAVGTAHSSGEGGLPA